mgnify:CR=1 FL=1
MKNDWLFLYVKRFLLTTRTTRPCAILTGCTPIGGVIAVLLISLFPTKHRLSAAFQLNRFITASWQQRNLIAGGRFLARLWGKGNFVETYYLLMGFCRDQEVSLTLNDMMLRDNHEMHAKSANCQIAIANSSYSIGHYRAAVAHFAAARGIRSDILYYMNLGLNAAYAEGILLKTSNAISYFGQYYHILDIEDAPGEDSHRELFIRVFSELASAPLLPRIVLDQASDKRGHRYGVFFHSSTQALGHAILDPYYFLALRRDQYDAIYFLGPARTSYRPASAQCLRLIEQHGVYTEVADPALMNASWMYLARCRRDRSICVSNTTGVCCAKRCTGLATLTTASCTTLGPWNFHPK